MSKAFFVHAWEQRKLGEVGSCQSGIGFPDSEQSGKEGIPFFKVSDMNINGNEYELKYSNNYVTDEQIKRRKWKPITDVPAMFFAKVGAAVMLNRKRLVNIPFLLDNNTMAYKFGDGWDTNFGRALFDTINLASLVQVGALPSYNASDVEDIEISMPSLYEQQKIGSYFQSLDNLITLHQRKCESLKKVKKSMLQKMFPKNGESVPEIRFAGFTDPWEQRKFSDITYLSGKKNKENLPYESYSVTNEQGFIPQNEQFENGGTMATADKTMYYIVSPNSFAYNPARINVGSIGYYENHENVIVSSLYEVFKTTLDVNDKFLWHWFKSEAFQKMIEKYQEGGVRLYFYYDKLCMCSLPMPSLAEQTKIGSYFQSLDNLITLHQRKVEKLKNLKKSMLQKMFV